ncbi:hypothetical protein OCN55_26110, partial [Escherichia coli]
LRTTPSGAEQEGQLMEMEATGAPPKHHQTLQQYVGTMTQWSCRILARPFLPKRRWSPASFQ